MFAVAALGVVAGLLAALVVLAVLPLLALLVF
jgi:hypothetical protein